MMKAESERATEADVIKEKEKYHERVSSMLAKCISSVYLGQI